MFGLQQFFYFCQECIDVKWNLRQINQIRTFALFCLSQCSCTCQPACITSHNFNNSDHVFFIGQTQCIADDFLCGSCNIFCGTSESRCVVCQSQVIINCFRNAKEFLFVSFYDCVIRQFLDGIHGIISSDIDEGINFQFIQNFKNFVINFHVLMDFRQFKTAGTQECRWGSFQQLDIQIRMNLCGHIHISLIQQTLNTIQHTIYFVKATLNCVLINTSQTGVNN